jgi:hypothetical protein
VRGVNSRRAGGCRSYARVALASRIGLLNAIYGGFGNAVAQEYIRVDTTDVVTSAPEADRRRARRSAGAGHTQPVRVVSWVV